MRFVRQVLPSPMQREVEQHSVLTLWLLSICITCVGPFSYSLCLLMIPFGDIIVFVLMKLRPWMIVLLRIAVRTLTR